MRQENNNIFLNLDWVLVLLYFALVAMGWMNIYAASYTEEVQHIFDFSTRYGKQLVWIGLSIPLIVFVLFINGKFYEKFSSIMYIASLVLLAGVLVVGKKVNGATSWYNFGGIGLQPSEFAKAFTALGVAKLMSDRKYDLKLFKNQVKAFIIIFLPSFLIALQPDMGSVLIYISFILVLSREGLNMLYILLGAVALVLFLTTIYFGPMIVLIASFALVTCVLLYGIYRSNQYLRFNGFKFLLIYLSVGLFIGLSSFLYTDMLSPHQKDRFDILLGIKSDKQGIGYNLHQAELTISSGGFFGKGFLKGDRTQGNFVPEQDTDYIFSVVAEEWGFFGSSFVILVFIALILRVLYLSEKTTNKFGRIYGYSVSAILLFHLVVNVGMVVGILPTIGIPLPFFSYGGSSLWGFTLLLFIFIRLDSHKIYDL